MIQATGAMRLTGALPLATTALDGTFLLSIRAVEQPSPHAAQWLLTWRGDAARLFYARSKSKLHCGAAVMVVACNVRPFVIGKLRTTEIHADLLSICLASVEANQA